MFHCAIFVLNCLEKRERDLDEKILCIDLVYCCCKLNKDFQQPKYFYALSSGLNIDQKIHKRDLGGRVFVAFLRLLILLKCFMFFQSKYGNNVDYSAANSIFQHLFSL